MSDPAFEIPREALEPNNGLVPKIKTLLVNYILKDGKPVEGSRAECVFEGQRFMYDGVFDNKLLIKHTLFDGWSILKGLCDIILHYRPYCIVEIGAGESTPVLSHAAETANVDFYSVDRNRVKLVQHSDAQQCMLGNSDDFMKQFDKTPAIVLIDGDHSYAQAKKEFDFFFECLVPGGIIFIHDTYPPHETFLVDTACGDVYKLRQELEKRTDEMDCFTWPYTAGWSGLTMVIKKEPDRPYWGI